MSEHARLSPSAASKWTGCPGSIVAEEGKPDTASPASLQGSAAHELLEQALSGESFTEGLLGTTMSNGVSLNAEDIAAVRLAEEYVLEQNYSTFITETRVPIEIPLEREDCWGTADVIGLKDRTVEVIDYKHGSGVGVDIESNLQLILYALGAVHHPTFAEADHVKITIIQPRKAHADGPIRSEIRTIQELMEWIPWLQERAAATDDPNAPRIAGEAQCQWCKDKLCKTKAEYALENALVVFDDATLEPAKEFPAPRDLTQDQMRMILDNEKLFTAWIKSIKELALSNALAGRPQLGYKLVAGRRGKEYTEDDEIIEKKLRQIKTLKGTKLNKSDVTVSKLLTPAQLLKTVKPLVNDKAFEKVNALINITDGSPTLVSESDKRKALPSQVEQAFADVEEVAPQETDIDLAFLS